MKYIPKSDGILRKLAHDIEEGRVFTSNHIQNKKDISIVFMPLTMLNSVEFKRIKKMKPVFLYEEMSRALPMGVNGMPIFFSFNFLNQADYDQLTIYIKKYRESIKKFI